MNYFNPYFYSYPTSFVQPKIGLLSRLFGSTGTSISNFLTGTQKVLNIANQTIPLVKQVKPMIGNAKTMFKVMNEFKRSEIMNNKSIINNNENETQIKTQIKEENITLEENNNGPTFFI